MKDWRNEIATLEARLAELKKLQVDFEQMPPEQRLAEVMHDVHCHYNHTDGCGWNYDRDWTGDTKKKYLQAAQKALKIVKGKTIGVEHLILVFQTLERLF